MSKWRLTGPAKCDMREIWRHIAKKDIPAADRVLDNIILAIQRLAELPDIGTASDHLLEGMRRCTVEGFVIYYIPSAPSLRVLRVIHGARDVDSSYFD